MASTQIKLNIAQNHLDFKLELIEKQAPIFKKGLFSKTLDPIKENLELVENYRTVTIKCLYSSCG
jgi:asparagine synthetase A